MALQVNIKARIDSCKDIIVTDITLPYSAGNTEGYGTPNPDITDITSATITITYPDGTQDIIDETSNLPSIVTGEIVFPAITPTTVADGLYTITYSVTGSQSGNPFTSEKTIKFINLCNIRCCLDNKWSSYISTCDRCVEMDTSLLEAEMLYRGISRGLAACSSETDIKYYIDKLQKLCNSSCASC